MKRTLFFLNIMITTFIWLEFREQRFWTHRTRTHNTKHFIWCVTLQTWCFVRSLLEQVKWSFEPLYTTTSALAYNRTMHCGLLLLCFQNSSWNFLLLKKVWPKIAIFWGILQRIIPFTNCLSLRLKSTFLGKNLSNSLAEKCYGTNRKLQFLQNYFCEMWFHEFFA